MEMQKDTGTGKHDHSSNTSMNIPVGSFFFLAFSLFSLLWEKKRKTSQQLF